MELYKCRYSLIDLNKTNIKPFKTLQNEQVKNNTSKQVHTRRFKRD